MENNGPKWASTDILRPCRSGARWIRSPERGESLTEKKLLPGGSSDHGATTKIFFGKISFSGIRSWPPSSPDSVRVNLDR
jgi:hypothetical protein